MKACKTIVLVGGVFVALFGLTLQAWGGGTPAGDPVCQVPNSGSSAIALRGTAVVEVLDAVTTGVTAVDLTLRLERGGNVQYFRESLSLAVAFMQAGDVVCAFLDVLSSDILTAFELSSSRQLKITNKSISKTDGYEDIDSPRASTIADITIYAQ